MAEIEIRPATAEDTPALLAIYAYYVERTAVTFEWEAPSLEEFRERVAGTLRRYPYLAAVRGGEVLGYAYAGPFHARAAYGWAAEATVYLAPDQRGQGLGRRLYQALEGALAGMGVLNLYACVAVPEPEDQYLTLASARFHQRLGFAQVGMFHRCGYKFGRWYHMIWMEKLLGPHGPDPDPVRPWDGRG